MTEIDCEETKKANERFHSKRANISARQNDVKFEAIFRKITSKQLLKRLRKKRQ